MNVFLLSASVIAIATYFPLQKQIRSGEVTQNLLTWVLWGVLDLLIAIEIIFEKGNFLLALTYAVGSFIISIFIFRTKHKVEWTWFETMVIFLVTVCIVIWCFSGTKNAILASTIAMFISGMPQLVDAYKKPHEMPIVAYVGYLAANCFSVAGGKNWSVEERFYPIMAGLLCFLILVCAARKFWIAK